MGSLQRIGLKHKTDKATFHKYCDFYQANLPEKIDRLLEIGIMDGASLKMWKEYYPDAEIIGIDISPPKQIDGVTCLQFDATDIYAFPDLGKFDVIIDDGSHMTKDQQTTFNFLYDNFLKVGGFYIMEDLHTSYMPNYINSELSTLEVCSALGFNIYAPTNEPMRSLTAMLQKV